MCRTEPSGGPKLDPHQQAEVAGPAAVPAAKAETVVTLRELQEALEEEVLTRQSLSRELEAIRTANQNFSRLESECGVPATFPALHPMDWLTFLSSCSQLQEAEVRNRDLEAHVRQLQERMEMLQPPGAPGESLTRPRPGGHRVKMGACWVCGHLGQPRLGHAEPPPFSALHAPYTSLLLPAVMGVPSPWAMDPPSHVRPLSSPSPLRSATHSPSPRPHLGLTLFGGSRRKIPFTQPAIHQLSLVSGPLPNLPQRNFLDSRSCLDSPYCLLSCC